MLRGKTVEELAEELIPVSHNQFSTRKCQIILDAVKADGDTTRDYQPERDEITRGLVKDMFGAMLNNWKQLINLLLTFFQDLSVP